MHEARPHHSGLFAEPEEPAAQAGGRADAEMGSSRAHAAQRSPQVTLGLLAMLITFVAIVFVPAVASLLGVQRGTAVTVAVGWLASWAATTVAYRRTGLSRLYLALDVVESLGIQAGVSLLLYRSGSVLSVFWLAYLGHMQVLASLGFCRQNLAVVGTCPAALTLAFWLKGDSASALVSLLVGVVALYVYNLLSRVYSSLEAALDREAQLKISLARVRVAEERNRIARDLHDGVAGELAALSWRLRRMTVEPEVAMADAPEVAMGHIQGRLQSVIESLRHVVLDLRQEHRTFAQTIGALRERCLDLCGNRHLVFSVFGTLDGPLAERVADDIDCIVSELVRNATTHAEARRVEVQIRIGDGVELHVSDDGKGLPPDYASRSSGGLANLRARVTRLGGEVDIRPKNPGTHFEVRFPTRSHDHGMVSSPDDY